MIIRFLTSIAGAGFDYAAGEVVVVDDEWGAALADGVRAERFPPDGGEAAVSGGPSPAGDLERVTAERDAALAELAALRAQLEEGPPVTSSEQRTAPAAGAAAVITPAAAPDPQPGAERATVTPPENAGTKRTRTRGQ